MCDCDCGDEGVRRESAYDMISVDAAVEIVLQQSQPLEVVPIEAYDADRFVLAEPVLSREPLPPFRASIMDGYAVIAADGVGTVRSKTLLLSYNEDLTMSTVLCGGAHRSRRHAVK